jgi:hypothetical protein
MTFHFFASLTLFFHIEANPNHRENLKKSQSKSLSDFIFPKIHQKTQIAPVIYFFGQAEKMLVTFIVEQT